MAFFQKVGWNFFRSPNLKEKYSKKTILSLKFKFPVNNSKVLLVGNLNFKLRIVFWNIFFWDLEIWKSNCTFWKKAPLDEAVVTQVRSSDLSLLNNRIIKSIFKGYKIENLTPKENFVVLKILANFRFWGFVGLGHGRFTLGYNLPKVFLRSS